MYIYILIYISLYIYLTIYVFIYKQIFYICLYIYVYIHIYNIFMYLKFYILYIDIFFCLFWFKTLFFYLCSLSVLFSDSSVVPFVRMYPSFFASLIVDFCRLFLFDKVVLFSILLPAKSPVAFHALLIVVSMLYLLHQSQILVHIIITLDLCFFFIVILYYLLSPIFIT